MEIKKNSIVKPKVAKAAKFLEGSLIPADLLTPKVVEKERVNNWETEDDDPSLSDPANSSPDPTDLEK